MLWPIYHETNIHPLKKKGGTSQVAMPSVSC